MRKLLFFSMFFCITITNAQKIRFNYDSAGNQVLRTWCPTCPSRTANQPVKEIAKLDESDFQKFFPEDVISYYPNPVKEELYLKAPFNDTFQPSVKDLKQPLCLQSESTATTEAHSGEVNPRGTAAGCSSPCSRTAAGQLLRSP